MKNIILIIFVSLASICKAQMSQTFLNLEYNTSQYQTADTDSIFIDDDSLVDILVHSWFLYESGYNNLGIELLIKDHDDNFTTTPTSVGQTSLGLIRDCHQSGQSDMTVYIYSSNNGIVTINGIDTTDNNYSSGYKKVPFDFEAADGIHCGFLFVKYEENSSQELIVTIEGYYWNPILKNVTGGSCPCNSDYLGLIEIEPNGINIPFEYINFLGQKVENPEGLVLKVYKSGYTEKVYF